MDSNAPHKGRAILKGAEGAVRNRLRVAADANSVGETDIVLIITVHLNGNIAVISQRKLSRSGPPLTPD